MISFLDRYFGYNYIMFEYKDWLKTTFITKWGTFHYKWIPYMLINVGVTFQVEMDTSFEGLVNKCIIIFMDYLTIFSRDRHDHPTHLTKICERCHCFGISLYPKKCIFKVTKGNLLAHITSKKGVTIKTKRVYPF